LRCELSIAAFALRQHGKQQIFDLNHEYSAGVPAFKLLRCTTNYGPEVMQSAAGCYHTSLTQQVIPVDATDGSAGTAILQRRKEGKRNNNQ
jgi:hypothetical protein